MAGMDVANVPTASFLEDVDSFMSSKSLEDVDEIIGGYNDMCQKYELIESQVQRKRQVYAIIERTVHVECAVPTLCGC